MSAPTRDQFTDDQRRALAAAEMAAEEAEAAVRMRQAEAFCNGFDEIAEQYDGPDGHIARRVRNRRGIREVANYAYGITS